MGWKIYRKILKMKKMQRNSKRNFSTKEYIKERDAEFIPLAATSFGVLFDQFLNFVHMLKLEARQNYNLFNWGFWVKFFKRHVFNLILCFSLHGKAIWLEVFLLFLLMYWKCYLILLIQCNGLDLIKFLLFI